MGAADVFPPRGEGLCVDVTKLVLTEGLYEYVCVCIGCGRR